VCAQRWWGARVSKKVLGGLVPWPIKLGFAFDSALKETDEPAELHAIYVSQFLILLLFVNPTQKFILPCSNCPDSVFLFRLNA